MHHCTVLSGSYKIKCISDTMWLCSCAAWHNDKTLTMHAECCCQCLALSDCKWCSWMQNNKMQYPCLINENDNGDFPEPSRYSICGPNCSFQGFPWSCDNLIQLVKITTHHSDYFTFSWSKKCVLQEYFIQGLWKFARIGLYLRNTFRFCTEHRLYRIYVL